MWLNHSLFNISFRAFKLLLVFCNYKQCYTEILWAYVFFVLINVYLKGRFPGEDCWAKKKSVYILLLSIAKLSIWRIVPIYISISAVHKYFPSFPTECVVIVFNFVQSYKWEVVSQSCFNLHFSNYEWVLTFFRISGSLLNLILWTVHAFFSTFLKSGFCPFVP